MTTAPIKAKKREHVYFAFTPHTIAAQVCTNKRAPHAQSGVREWGVGPSSRRLTISYAPFLWGLGLQLGDDWTGWLHIGPLCFQVFPSHKPEGGGQ